MRLPWRRRVPLVLQMSTVECGAACLAMVLGAFGRHTSLAECRDACGEGDGNSAADIVRAARGFGLRARGLRVRRLEAGVVRLPAIARWERSHFVVLERWLGTKARVVDPARGRLTLPMEEIRPRVDVVLEFEPGPDLVRRARPRGELWAQVRPLIDLRRTAGLVAQVLVASLLLSGLGLTLPVVTKVVVDSVIRVRTDSLTLLTGAGVAALVLAQLSTAYLRSAVLTRLQGQADWHALRWLIGHLMRLPIAYFQHRATGDIMLRMFSIAQLRELLANQTLSNLIDALLAAGYLVVLVVVNPAMAFAVAALAAAALLLMAAMRQPVQEAMARELHAQTAGFGRMVEALRGILTVRSMAAEGRVVEGLDSLMFDWMHAAVRRSHIASVIEAATASLRLAGPILVLWLGTEQVRAGRMTPGVMLMSAWIATAVLTPLSALILSGQRLQLVGAQIRRLGDVVHTAPEPAGPPGARPRLRGGIEARNISFHYHANRPAILQDVSLRVEPGWRVALVGRTGAGKSTLAMLLLGLYPPARGEVLLDDVPIRELHMPAVRGQFGVVHQEPWVFEGSVRENLTLSEPGYSDEDLRWAMRVAELESEVAARPMGLDARIGERGTGLSGGQRQRLAIARAVLRRPAILFLDEATSHLDAATEARVCDNLRGLASTQIVIAHRLSTVRDADLIVVLDAGRIAECGQHSTLLAAGGIYAQLLGGQLETAEPR